ncbi:acyl-CoA dehydrogenase [Acinetobacter radioresistens]|uniref:acyl-CoA dehydrogenase n=1 Tax=Acinetobacter radioresistens TaxID=40216 RepID=UPI00094611D4|nr:acyl-CoA dehydrogenase [Acinetobacter radioresistens]
MSNEKLISRADLDFILFDWLKVDQLNQNKRFSGQSRFEYESVLDIYEKISTELFANHNKKNDTNEPFFDGKDVHVNPEVKEALKAFADAGLVSAAFPSEWNGMNLPSSIERAGMAYILAANPGTAGYAFLTIANANLLITHGEESKISPFVNKMSEGKCFGTMCLSEPQAGSSLADIRTRAVPAKDGTYRIFGNKMWISGGDHNISENILHLVLAKIPDENGKLPNGVDGISLFTVPKYVIDKEGNPQERNDISLAGINHKMGNRGTVNCVLNFGEGTHTPHGEAGAVGELLGEPSKGLKYMFHMMNEARISVGLSAAAIGYTGYLHALEYSKTRLQGRLRNNRDLSSPQSPIIKHADVRRMLLAQKSYTSGALALCLYASRIVDELQVLEDIKAIDELKILLDLLTPVVKSWSAQWGLVANDLAIQVHGGYGYTREYNVEQFYRDNRLNPIHEGTFGIQAIDLLGRKTKIKDKLALKILSSRILDTIDRSQIHSELKSHSIKLEQSWQAISNVTDFLHGIQDEDVQLANAANYLEAFGHLVVGWLWLDQATAILENKSALDHDFLNGKLAACDYFFGWEIPKINSWLSVLNPIETTPLNICDKWF